jgi:hypothetical protein
LETEGGTVTYQGDPEPDPVRISECELDPAEGGVCSKKSKVVDLGLRYVGGECSDSSNGQGSKFKCEGSTGGQSPIDVIYTGKDASKIIVSPSDGIELGDVFHVIATGRKELHAETKLEAADGGAYVNIHTSCSQPLGVGDRFGPFEVVSFVGKDGVLHASGSEVKYTYIVTNPNATSIDNVSIVDDQIGVIVSGLSLEPGESAAYEAFQMISEDTTNVAFATADSGGGFCAEAVASATVTVVAPPPPPEPPRGSGLCADKESKPATVFFEYTGEGCDASTNLQEGKFVCSGDPDGATPISVVFEGKDASKTVVTPSSGIAIGSVFSIARQDGRKLRAETKFQIRQGGETLQSLNVHTSCSKPLAVGDKFGGVTLTNFILE